MARNVKRSYDNSARRQHSDDTRARILDAAADLIAAQGYRATTVTALARAADVHVDTVYALVGRKPEVVRALIERAVSGTADAVPPDERDYVIAMRAESDPAAKLAIYAGAVRRINERLAPLLVALRDAAATDPDALSVFDEINERRARNMRALVRDLGPTGTLRAGLSVDRAADVVWVSAGADVFLNLTVGRGWSIAAYERWLADTLQRTLLAST